MDPARILVVDDSSDMRRLICLALRAGSYEFSTAENGRVGLAMAFSEHPDLVVVDFHMPEMDGLEVTRQLKHNWFTSNIPILILTADSDPETVVRGLEAGADDYVRKPFDPRELQARVAAMLRRTRRYVDTDPLTKLPGNAVLRDELKRRLDAGDDFAVCYIDLDEFKSYVDHYGFEPASRVIQETARICYNQMVEHGAQQDFIGHIGGDDFVVVTDPSRAEAVCEGIVNAFDARRESFYDAEAVARGGFVGPDRYGVERQFPLMSLTIAVLLPGRDGTTSLDDLAAEAARRKRDLKSRPGSNWSLFE